MDIHEYQAKEILSGFGIPVPKGGIAYGPEQAGHRARDLGGSVWAVKAQVHSGGRGEAGGVRICRSEDEVIDFSADLLGSKLVTKQSGKRGRIVGRLYVEEGTEIDREIYLGLILDRESERVVVAGSAEGGMEIEEIAEKRPETIKRVIVDPALGMRDFQARELAFELGLNASQIAEATRIITGCYRAFRELDATMVEINPLVVTKAGNLIALDAKMSFDDNALFRRQKISELRDKTQEDPLESHAQDRGLSYVGLDGNIGCMINGAGLAMATLDMIKLSGGEPANFLDVGGGASPERILMAFKAVLKNPRVEAILVNIFAGINRCDWVAEGVVKAYEQLDLTIPVVVRLAGTNVEKGREILTNANLPIIVADTLADAAEKAVAATRKEA